MLNIVILEDQAEQAERLRQMLDRYAASHPDFSYSLKLYDRAIPLVTDYKCDADLLFLDIQVPDMSGMELARRIRAMDGEVMIIFITMLTQYAIEGYSVGAFDYVLKPVRYEEFSAMPACHPEQAAERRSRRILFDTRGNRSFDSAALRSG